MNFCGLLLILFLAGLQAQTPYFYYYKGQKQYIELNTQQAFVKDSISVFSNKKINLLQYGIVQAKEGAIAGSSEIYFSEKLSPQAYLDKLSALQTTLQVPVKAYLKIGNDDKVRLSDILENKEIINNFKKLSTIL